jgi:hypothetical protein
LSMPLTYRSLGVSCCRKPQHSGRCRPSTACSRLERLGYRRHFEPVAATAA